MISATLFKDIEILVLHQFSIIAENALAAAGGYNGAELVHEGF
jgi:hypothetical protein